MDSLLKKKKNNEEIINKYFYLSEIKSVRFFKNLCFRCLSGLPDRENRRWKTRALYPPGPSLRAQTTEPHLGGFGGLWGAGHPLCPGRDEQGGCEDVAEQSSWVNSILPGDCSSQRSEKGQAGRKLLFSGTWNHLVLPAESSRVTGQLGNVKAN